MILWLMRAGGVGGGAHLGGDDGLVFACMGMMDGWMKGWMKGWIGSLLLGRWRFLNEWHACVCTVTYPFFFDAKKGRKGIL
jgi:hypothetical protein